jgi:GTPase SAR1 family protein
VYSVTSRQSLEMVKIIRDKILNHTVWSPIQAKLMCKGTEWVPICLVGNKSDLEQQRYQSFVQRTSIDLRDSDKYQMTMEELYPKNGIVLGPRPPHETTRTYQKLSN